MIALLNRLKLPRSVRLTLKWFTLGLLSLLLIVLLAFSLLISTETGLQWLSARAQSFIPGLTISHIEGCLIDAMRFQGIQYRNNNIDIKIDNGSIEWQPSQLFRRTINIHTLNISGLEIKQLAAAPVKKASSNQSLENTLKTFKLPLNLKLDSLGLNDVRYQAVKTTPITLQQLSASASIIEKSIAIQPFSIKQLQLVDHQINTHGELNIHASPEGIYNPEKTFSNIHWDVTPNTLKTLRGTTTLTASNNKNQFHINTNIASPYTSTISLAIDQLLTDPQIIAGIHLQSIALSDIDSNWPKTMIDGKVNAIIHDALTDVSAEFSSGVTINVEEQYIATVNTNGQWQNRQLTLNMNTSIPELVEQLKLNGSIQPDLLNVQSNTEEAIQLQLEWVNLKATNANKTALYSPSGKLTFNGQPTQYYFDLNTDFFAGAEKKQKGQLQITGNGSTEHLKLNNITLTGPMGYLDGDGDIAIKPTLTTDFRLSGTQINPSVFHPDWPGSLAIISNIQTTQANDNISVINFSTEIQGSLREQPFALQTKARYTIHSDAQKKSLTNNQLTIDNIQIDAGKSQLRAKGELIQNQSANVDWSITSDQLTDFAPDLQGQLRTKGQFQTHLKKSGQKLLQTIIDTATINASITGNSIAVNDTRIKKINGNILVTPTNIPNSTGASKNNAKIRILAQEVSTQSARIDTIQFSAQGHLDQHELRLNAKSSEGSLTLDVSGQWRPFSSKQQKGAQWLFTLLEATITPPQLAAWKLNRAVNGEITTTHAGVNTRIDNSCWNSLYKSSTATMCFGAEQQAASTQARFTIEHLPTEYFDNLFPEGLAWNDSMINGKGQIAFTKPNNTTPVVGANIELTTTTGTLDWQPGYINDGKIQTESFTLEPGRFSLQANKQALEVLLKLPIEQQPGINGSLTIENNTATFTERKLSAQLQLALNQLSPLTSFIPDANHLKGELTGQWQAGGTVSNPWLEGQLQLNNGQVLLETPNIQLTDIDFLLTGDQQSGFRYQASANSGDGILQANGNATFAQDTSGGKFDQPTLTLNVKGKDVQVFATEEATVYASPDLNILSSANTVKITGAVTIPKASITPKRLPKSVASISDDQIIIDDQTSNTRTDQTSRQQITMDVDVTLGDQVAIDGFGFKGLASGTIAITKEAQGPTLGNGEIAIKEGEYRALGQGLVIDKGLILFTGGPIAKPGIDIKALRRPDENVTVGVFARGPIEQPRLTIFSEPSMTQSEQLSWLVLGRPLEQSSEGESNAINQLLLSLSLKQGDTFLSNLSDTFKLDTVRIKTGSDEAGAASDNDLAELVLGKYLSPELYVTYGIGLFKPVNVLSLEYSLGRYWKLTSETSSESSGGDIVYTIEK